MLFYIQKISWSDYADKSLIRDIGRVSEWCLLGMKLNASKTKTTIGSRSRTVHTQLPPFTIGGVLKESITLLYWEWHLIQRWPLRSIFARLLETLFKDLVSWASPGEYSTIDRFLGEATKTTGPRCQWCPVSNWGFVWVWYCSSLIWSEVVAVGQNLRSTWNQAGLQLLNVLVWEVILV